MSQPTATPIHTPYLALDLDAFDRNVAKLAQAITQSGGKRWRPHIKAIRSPELALQLQAAGATGITCATAREARAMAAAGITDILIATQVVQPQDLEIVAHLNRHATVMIAIDAPQHASLVAMAARAAGTRIPVVIEVEVGLERAGALPGADAVALAQLVHANADMKFCGFMAWEGHTTRVADAAAKREAIKESVSRLTSTAALCEEAGLQVDVVSCGGTGTYEVTSTLAGVTELQAGGGVFGDLRYREDFGIALEPALTLYSTVLARPTATRVVCDAGFKALAVYPKAPRLSDMGGIASLTHSAEHLTINLKHESADPAIGSRIRFEIGYADATTFLHRQIAGMRSGEVQTIYDLIATR